MKKFLLVYSYSCILIFGSIVPWFVQGGTIFAQEEKGKEDRKIPSLKKILQIVFKISDSSLEEVKKKVRFSRGEREYKVKQHYYKILLIKEQLRISKEVKGYFEKAITKSEEKYREGDENISQSDITKLKLGLTGTENDIVSLKSNIELEKISLGREMGWDITYETPIEEKAINAVKFPFKDFSEYLYKEKIGIKPKKISGEKKFILEKAFIKANEAREKMNLAKKIKKITRALLVTEVANYDFGIGDSQELFEALIIYSRVLKGFYESTYNFNMAIADLDKLDDLPLFQ